MNDTPIDPEKLVYPLPGSTPDEADDWVQVFEALHAEHKRDLATLRQEIRVLKHAIQQLAEPFPQTPYSERWRASMDEADHIRSLVSAYVSGTIHAQLKAGVPA